MRYLSKGGFTLLELIIVMFIAGISLAITSVAISRSIEKSVVREEAVKLEATLMRAREFSIMQREPFTFALDAESGAYWLEKSSGPYGNAVKIAEGLKIEGEPIRFLPKGSSTGGGIIITDRKGRGFHIEVDSVTGAAGLKRI